MCWFKEFFVFPPPQRGRGEKDGGGNSEKNNIKK
jgi:hypothetical protein